MTDPAHAPRPARGRPRKEGAEQRILEAALEEYAERGWSGFTMDAVARRAGVGKSTVYLRWSDKDSLLTDAVTTRSQDIEQVDTGSLRGDLERLAANLFRYLLDPAGWATLRMAMEAAIAPTPLGSFTEVVSGQHLGAASEIVQSHLEAGTLPTDAPVRTLVECLYGAVIVQTLSLAGDDRKLTDEDIEERVRPIVDLVLAPLAG
ncbi:AcrR family transcriptional regulator [Nocardioides ginsengisegetis]|uniref:AcrR family transcriptional regulator n=1 Tax=Nocardioides ginsengisegetis TaxID=661491 RepID=A0A7W3IWF6_9ACTN|nr:TetR/AcrR family transcriptional regulator [Nocardioides ginsengisegetis]MBA8801873.1 AcrR family transcriptional regulator [Nocardioides ginsengisegetis]